MGSAKTVVCGWGTTTSSNVSNGVQITSSLVTMVSGVSKATFLEVTTVVAAAGVRQLGFL